MTLRIAAAATAVCLACFSAPASAADANLIGHWTSTGETNAARLGQAIAGWPATDKPAFNLSPRPSVVIDVQEGRKLAGHEIFADGSREDFVGVIKRDGRSVLVSTMKGLAMVDLDGDSMEWCWVDTLDALAVVSCDVMRKDPAAK